MVPLRLSAYTLVSALGRGRKSTWDALMAGRSGLLPCNLPGVDLQTCIGRVDGLEESPVPARGGRSFAAFDCRNNRLAALTLLQDGFIEAVSAARVRYGPDRVAVLLGTSTSGIAETEAAYAARHDDGSLPQDFIARYRFTHNTFSLAAFVRDYLDLDGPAAVISTACSSSAKVFATASRLFASGQCDAAVVGGCDSLCLTTLYGFTALQLTSSTPCRPGDASRDGLSLGEAGAFILLERPDPAADGKTILLRGYGESNDGYHMSHPHPEGRGAVAAMRAALTRARLSPASIDAISLHGTATRANDAVEDSAVHSVFGGGMSCIGIKGWTGHTLGAAGAIGVVIAGLCMEHDVLPGTVNTRTVDPAFRSRLVLTPERRPLHNLLLNCFGFGGNNACLILGAAPC